MACQSRQQAVVTSGATMLLPAMRSAIRRLGNPDLAACRTKNEPPNDAPIGQPISTTEVDPNRASRRVDPNLPLGVSTHEVSAASSLVGVDRPRVLYRRADVDRVKGVSHLKSTRACWAAAVRSAIWGELEVAPPAIRE